MIKTFVPVCLGCYSRAADDPLSPSISSCCMCQGCVGGGCFENGIDRLEWDDSGMW